MAEPKKKTATKKTPSSSKKTAPKKSTTKKATTKAPATTKKAPPAKKTVTKTAAKTTPKKAITPKKTVAKKTVKTIPVSPAKKITTDSIATKKSITDMSIFATFLAVIVVALVVLGWYMYSRQMQAVAPTSDSVVSEPQRVSISASVVLTPEVISTLESLVAQIAVSSDEILLDVRKIDDVDAAKTQSPDFFLNAQQWDFVFEFKSTSVLFRPSTKQIINTGIIPKK